MKTSKEKYRESFLIVVSSWNCDLILMLEHPLSHYWTSPLSHMLKLLIITKKLLIVGSYDKVSCKTSCWIREEMKDKSRSIKLDGFRCLNIKARVYEAKCCQNFTPHDIMQLECEKLVQSAWKLIHEIE